MSPDDRVDNATIDGILEAMGQGAEPEAQADVTPAQQSDDNEEPNGQSPPVEQAGVSALGDLLMEVETSPDGDSTAEEPSHGDFNGPVALESMLTEVDDEPTQGEVPVADAVEIVETEEPAPAPPETTPPTAAAPSQPAAPSPASAPGRMGPGVWPAAALVAFNTIAILILAAGLSSFRTNQERHFSRLIGVIHEDLQARRATVEKQGDEDILDRVEEAGRLFDSAQYDVALPLLRQASEAFPGRHDLLWRRALSGMHLKRWHEAAEAMRDFTKRFPENKAFAEALMHMGRCYEELGLYGRARRTYYQLIALSGRLTDDQQRLVPSAYGKIADCYRLQALSMKTKKVQR